MGPTTADGDALHWVELPEFDFGAGLRLPLRLSFESDRVKGPREFGAKSMGWRSPALHAQIVLKTQARLVVLLPCGKLMHLTAAKDAPGTYATADGEWQGRMQEKKLLVSREDGWELEYDAAGWLARLRTDAGRTVLWNRNAIGQLLTVTEGEKVGLKVIRDTKTLVITALEVRTAAAGLEPQVLVYHEDRLAGIQSPDGRTESYAYDTDAAGNLLLTITGFDLVKRILIWNPQSHRLVSDGLWTYQIEDQYSTSFPRFTRTGPNGEVESFLDDSTKSGVIAYTSADGTITQREKVTSAGPARGQLRRVTRQLAGVKEAVTLYQAEHDARGLLVAETDALGRKTAHAYELHGATLQSGIKRKVTTNPLGAKLGQEFDSHGNLIAITDPLGHTSRHEYDAQNRRVRTTGPGDVVVEVLVYDEQGRLAARTDALGATTKHGYDMRGNRITTTDALGNVTKNEYNQRGLRTATTDALGHTTRFEYDAGGRLIATFLPPVSSAQKAVPENSEPGTANREPGTRHAYDPQGRRIRSTGPDGTVLEATTYDAFGRATSRTDALGNVTRYEFEVKRGCATCSAAGQPTRIISPDGRVTERVYDADRHLIAETLAAGTPAAATTRHTYDLAGNRLTTTDALGRVTQFQYDAANRRTAVIHPDQTQRTFAFNANGQVIAETDELGHITKRDYDAHGNLIAITDPAGHTTQTFFGSGDESSPKAVKADESSALQKHRAAGHAALHRPTLLISAAGIRTQIDYDVLGRRIALTKAPGTAEASTTRHEFDTVGNEIKIH